MSGVRVSCTVALIIVLFLSQGDAATSLHEVQRNGNNVTVRCETDLLRAEIIWYIGNRRFIPDRYGRNGRLVTATETIPVIETIQVICIGRNWSTSENDTLILEVPTDSPTIVTTVATDTDDSEFTTSSATVSSNNTPRGTDSVTEATSTTPSENTCGARCITGTDSVTETTSTIPSENTCGVGCIVGIAAAISVLVLLLVLLVIFLVCWKRKRLATWCSKAKVGLNKSPRNGDLHQSGQQTGIPTPPTSPPVTETDSRLQQSTMVIPVPPTGPERNRVSVTTETDNDGAVELVVLTSRRQQPSSSIHRQSSVEGLPTNTYNNKDTYTCIPDRRGFTAEYGSPSQPAHTVINMDQEEPQ